MARRLTDITIKGIKAKAEYFEVVDGTTGLRLAVFPSGARSWIARYRRPGSGRTAKLTLGRYPDLSLSAARIRVAEARAAVGKGADPGEDKRCKKIEDKQVESDRARDTVDRHGQAFLDWQLKRLRPEGWRQQRHVICDYMVPAWGRKTVHDVRKRDVIELIEGIAQDKPVMANRALSVIRRFFRWLRGRDVVALSPCDGVGMPSVEQSRDRALSHTEIKSLWHALDTIGGPACAAIKVMLLTGARRSEVGNLPWTELDGDVWLLPEGRSKNKKSHIVPLSDQALAVIKQQPRIDGCEFVFTADGSKPVANFSHTKRQIDALMQPDTPKFRLHDLRRTLATNLQKLNVPIHVTEAVLNHHSGTVSGIAAVYQIHDYFDEKRAALAAWGRELDHIIAGKTAKIVRLR
jgi:integrase